MPNLNKRHTAILILLILVFWASFSFVQKKQKLPVDTEIAEQTPPLQLEAKLPAPKAPEPEPTTLEKLTQQIQANDYCNLKTDGIKKADLWELVLKAPEPAFGNAENDGAIRRLFRGGPLDMDGNDALIADPKEKIELFYNALHSAHMILGNRTDYNSTPDYKHAIATLEKLEELDSDNAIYPLIHGCLLRKTGSTLLEVRPYFIRAINSERYDTMMKIITRRIYEKAFYNSAFSRMAFKLGGELPIPDMHSCFALLKSFIRDENYEEFVAPATAFAYRMRPVVPPEGRFEFYEWSALDFTYANNILITVSKVTHPGAPLPDLASSMDRMTFFKLNEFPATEKFFLQGVCDPKAIDLEIQAEAQRYFEYRKAEQATK